MGQKGVPRAEGGLQSLPSSGLSSDSITFTEDKLVFLCLRPSQDPIGADGCLELGARSLLPGSCNFNNEHMIQTCLSSRCI